MDDYMDNFINCKNISIEISYICLPKKITKTIEDVLGKYQISLDKTLSSDYLDSFLNARQITNLTDCLKNLNDTDPIIANQLPFDLLSIEVRDGIKNLSRITGQELTEDLLNNIFSKFCIGK